MCTGVHTRSAGSLGTTDMMILGGSYSHVRGFAPIATDQYPLKVPGRPPGQITKQPELRPALGELDPCKSFGSTDACQHYRTWNVKCQPSEAFDFSTPSQAHLCTTPGIYKQNGQDLWKQASQSVSNSTGQYQPLSSCPCFGKSRKGVATR